MKVFHCDHCGSLLFFENVTCLVCGRALAYVPERSDIASLDAVGGNLWRSPLSDEPLRLCENYQKHDVCNWALPASDPNPLCRACRLTRTIPDLSRPDNARLWYKLEIAKRRLLYTLEQLRLPIETKQESPERGLAFDFLEEREGQPRVMTGHAHGIITVSLTEADDAERVKRRESLHEPYRTLLGHFRHESGHYYWERLLASSPRIEAFRRVFGDERADYAQALARHYDSPRADWQDSFISAYAAMHPWEDWAETWAHYLHMTDTLETAAACGVSITPRRRDEPRASQVVDPVSERHPSFDRMMETWGSITYVMNNLSRGLGNDDAYPFVIAPAVARKLRFVHESITRR